MSRLLNEPRHTRVGRGGERRTTRRRDRPQRSVSRRLPPRQRREPQWTGSRPGWFHRGHRTTRLGTGGSCQPKAIGGPHASDYCHCPAQGRLTCTKRPGKPRVRPRWRVKRRVHELIRGSDHQPLLDRKGNSIRLGHGPGQGSLPLQSGSHGLGHCHESRGGRDALLSGHRPNRPFTEPTTRNNTESPQSPVPSGLFFGARWHPKTSHHRLAVLLRNLYDNYPIINALR